MKHGKEFKTDQLSQELKDKARLINIRAAAQEAALAREVEKLKE